MTLVSTQLYDAWLSLLRERDVDKETAKQIVEVTLGDPRIAWPAGQTDADVRTLRGTLQAILDELDLSEFGSIGDHEECRDALLTAFDSAFAAPEVPVDVDREEHTITREVEETGSGLAGGVVAGAGGDLDRDEITPRDEPLADEDIWGEGTTTSDEKATDDDNADSEAVDGTTHNSSKRASNDETDHEQGGQSDTQESTTTDDSDEQPLRQRIPRLLLGASHQEINESLEPPLRIVDEDLLDFGTRSVGIYRSLVKDALFPDHSDAEQEVLFQKLVESRIREHLDELASPDDSDGKTQE